MEKENLIDAEKLIQNFKITNIKAFTAYLKEVYFDLVKRSKDPSKGIDKTTFNSYYKLPGIIGDRLYHVFDNSSSGYIDLEEFTNNMKNLFCSSFDEISKIIFKFYDFNNNGEISKEDIRIILSYITLNIEEIEESSKEFNYNERVKSQKELDEILDKCFNNNGCDKSSMNYFNFVEVIEHVNSDIFFLILLFLYDKKPFSKIGLIEYEKQRKITSNNYDNISSPPKYVKRPRRNSTFSSCLTNLRSPNRKKSLFDEQINKTLIYRGGKKIKTVKENNKNVIGFLKEMDIDSDDDNIIQVSRKKYQNLKKIEDNKEKKKKVSFIKNDIKITPAVIMKKNNEKQSTKNPNKKSNLKTNKLNKKKNENNKKENDKLPSNKNETKENMEKNEDDKIIDFEESDYSEDEEIIKYEGYLYKIKDDELKKLWFKLIHNDLYYFKNKDDSLHKGLFNLSGVFIEKIPNLIKKDKTYFGFSLNFPNKKFEYYTDDKNSYKLWFDSLSISTGSTNLTKDYIIGNEIGSGKFGVIKLCTNKTTGKKFALKILCKKNMDLNDLDLVRTEIEILKICQHPNIIKLYETFENSEYFYIIMEYCSGSDLFSYIEKSKFKLSEKKACEIIFKLCRALYYIHSYGIIHRDLKPENILMTDNSSKADIRILDFGLSKILGPDETCNEPYGTLSYCAPEVIKGENYNKQADLFSIGVITYLLLCGQLPFNHKDSEKEIARLTIYEEPTFKSKVWKNISSEAIDFIKGMIRKNPKDRFNIKEAIEHNWFKKFYHEDEKFSRRKSAFEMYSSPID